MQNCWSWLLGIALISFLIIVLPITLSGGDKKEKLQPIFDEYIKKFNKSYKNDPVEYEARLQNFMVSYDEIENLNSQSRGPEEHRARYGLTHLSDLSKTEYKELHLSDEQLSVRPTKYDNSFKDHDYYYNYYKDLIDFFKDFHANTPPKNKTKLAAVDPEDKAAHEYFYNYYKDYFSYWMDINANRPEKDDDSLKMAAESDDVFPKLSVPLSPEDKAAIHDYYYNYYKDYFSFWMDINANKTPKDKTKLTMEDEVFPVLSVPLSPEDKAAIHDYYYNYYKDYFSFWADINASKTPKDKTKVKSSADNNVFPNLTVPLSPEDKDAIHDYYFNYYKDYISFWMDMNGIKPSKNKTILYQGTDFLVLTVPLSPEDKAAIHDYYYNYYKDYFSFWMDINANKPAKDNTKLKSIQDETVYSNLTVPLSPEDKAAIHDYYYNYYKDYFSFWMDINANKPPKNKTKLTVGMEDNTFPKLTVPLSPEDKAAIHDYYYNFYKDYFSFWMDINASKPPKDKAKEQAVVKDPVFSKLAVPLSPEDKAAIHDYYYNYYKDYYSYWIDINANKPPKSKTKLYTAPDQGFPILTVPLSPEDKTAIHDYYADYYKSYYSFWIDMNASKPPKDKAKLKVSNDIIFPNVTAPVTPEDKAAIHDYYYNYYKDYFSFWMDINANKPPKNKTKLNSDGVFPNLTVPLSPKDKAAIHDYYYNYYKDYFSFWIDVNANKPTKDKTKLKSSMEDNVFPTLKVPLSPEDKAAIHDYYYNYYKDYFSFWMDINADKPTKNKTKLKTENDGDFPTLTVPMSPEDKAAIHDYYYNYYKDYISFWMDVNASKPSKDKSKLTSTMEDNVFPNLKVPLSPEDKAAIHDYYYNYYKDYFSFWMDINANKPSKSKTKLTKLKAGDGDDAFPKLSVPLSPEDKDAIHDYYYNYYKDYFSFWMDINANKPIKDKTKLKSTADEIGFPKLKVPLSPEDKAAIHDYYYNYYKDYFSFWMDINANKPPKDNTKLTSENDEIFTKLTVPLSPEDKAAIHDYYYNYYKDYFSFWMDINANKPIKDKTKLKSTADDIVFPKLKVPLSPEDKAAIHDYYYNYYKDYFSFWMDINANKPPKDNTKLTSENDEIFTKLTVPLSPEDKAAIHDYYYNYYKDYFSFWMDINANKPVKDKTNLKSTADEIVFPKLKVPLSPEDKAAIHDYYYNYYKDYFSFWMDINANKPPKDNTKLTSENNEIFTKLTVPLSPEDKAAFHDYYYNYYKDYFSYWMDMNANKPSKLTLKGQIDDKIPVPQNDDDKVAIQDYYFNYYKDYYSSWMDTKGKQPGKGKGSYKDKYGYKPTQKSGPVFSRKKRSDLPLHVDWRVNKVIGPVKNQGVCGACWAFSTIGAMEAVNAIKTGKLEPLSVQEVIDCARLGNTGCSGGDICLLLSWLSMTGAAVAKESEYPLRLTDGVCRLSKNTTGVQLKSFTCDDFVGREDMILQTIATHGPVAVAVNALTWQNYLGGVVQYNCDGSASSLNHAVELVGYDLTGTVPYYIAKNSWGPEFGNNGYIHLAVGNNMCGLANEVGIVDVKP